MFLNVFIDLMIFTQGLLTTSSVTQTKVGFTVSVLVYHAQKDLYLNHMSQSYCILILEYHLYCFNFLVCLFFHA